MSNVRSPVPPLAQQVLELFSHELVEVRFPDMDRSVLMRALEQLDEAQFDLEAAEEALAAGRTEVALRVQALTMLSQRALGYARVYAQGNAELEARLAELSEKPAEVGAESAGKRRTRSKKLESERGLFATGEPEADAMLENTLM
jgi:hypothetical protein